MYMVCIERAPLSPQISIPPSKSHTLRAILFAALAKGSSLIHGYLQSPDAESMIRAVQSLGARVEKEGERLKIWGTGGEILGAEDVIDAGNSGLVLRLIGGVAALGERYTVITGDHSIRSRRQIMPLIEGLTQLKAFAVSSRLDGYAPLIVKGKMEPGHAVLSGEDSQPVSALLIACAFLKGKTTLEVHHPGERPWIDLTLHWLRRFGIGVLHRDYTHYEILGNAEIEGFEERIPGDWSSAAFPLVAALITGSEMTIENVDLTDCQGDKKLIFLLQERGAKIDIGENSLSLKKGSVWRGGEVDLNDCIDALPILSVLACFGTDETQIKGCAICRHKESNRIEAIRIELEKMGARIEELPDGLRILPSPLVGASLTSHQDHRIAMALCVAALGAKGKSEIQGLEAICKTYPTFIQDLLRPYCANV
ncbi:MAG: 3-phosphoshikimate 1-carboxyvinyltransferase [Verrucomicrobia bacterium]|nr:3-phosphoshikimate 1-carboxyvinyltransferase [Verrucomicrobiota bacterium]